MIKANGMRYDAPCVSIDSWDDFMPIGERINPRGVNRGALSNVVGASHVAVVFIEGLGWADCDAQWLDAQGYKDVKARGNDRWRSQ